MTVSALRKARTAEVHICLHVPANASMQKIMAAINAFAKQLDGTPRYEFDRATGRGTYHIDQGANHD